MCSFTQVHWVRYSITVAAHTQLHRGLIFRPLDCLNFYIAFVCYYFLTVQFKFRLWLYKCRKPKNNLPHKRRIKCYRKQSEVFGKTSETNLSKGSSKVCRRKFCHTRCLPAPMNCVLELKQDSPHPVQQLVRIWKRLGKRGSRKWGW